MFDSNSVCNALEQMNKMLINFEELRCGDGFKPCPEEIRAAAMSYFTDYSIKEILKSSFGKETRSNYAYSSDSAYTSDSQEYLSSSDDYLTDNDSWRSSSPGSEQTDEDQPLDLSKTSKYFYQQQVNHVHLTPNQIITARLRRNLEEDGYTSSDSETAIDLRVRRKKTPPHRRQQLPAWVFCTRYSDRPSAG